MGADSTALLLRWIADPSTRPCPLADLLVITAMTGDEWPVTGQLVERHILPLMRQHRIRYAQIARAGARQGDGLVVLDDSREPRQVHLAGAYRLSQEMITAGTVPQAAGARKCSAKAKGWPLDTFTAQATAGHPYLHVVGFESGETGRAARDSRCGPAQRTPSYPLIDWGWDRQRCEDYISEQLGVGWPKSACTYCPYALCSATGRERVLAAYAAEPGAAVDALVMERIAVTFNPRQGLAAGVRLASLLASSGRHQHLLALLETRLDEMPWRLVEVRRAILPSGGDPARRGRTIRSVHTISTGSRTQMTAALAGAADRARVLVTAEDGIGRAWLRRRSQFLPSAEWFYAATPNGPEDKKGPGFADAWPLALAGPAQGELDLFGGPDVLLDGRRSKGRPE
jgi:hypothetical protein